ncbi:MAG: helix-hairpin-helix domain-containing protein [Rheinheimera sp.]|nr:helix-hairpin-helix domain-containing protein [Rheinheimera sp.]
MNMKALWFALCATIACMGAQSASAALNNTTNTDSKTVGAVSQSKLSLNKADQQQLEAIPGIGAKKAQAILEYIKQHGPIKDKKQLMEVKGIGEKMADRIAGFVSFG